MMHPILRQQWLVACTSRELRRKPLARTILDVPVVVFRTPHQVGALLDRCPHRNAPLSAGKVINDCLQCPYHGWQFDVAGVCQHRPGVTAATAAHPCDSYAVLEQDGMGWVNLAQQPPPNMPPRRPWWDDLRFQSFIWIDKLEAELVDALENLLDGTHTPFVHAGLVRRPDQAQHFQATVRLKDGIAEAEYSGEGKQSGWISRLFERDRVRSYGRFVPPCMAELEYTSKRGTEFVLLSHFTPEQGTTIRVYSVFFLRKSLVPAWIKRLVLRPFFRSVLKQDTRILRLQQQNIARFGGQAYQYWEGDLLRGWIEAWLKQGKIPEDGPAERTIELKI